MADYRALAQALDPYAMDTGGITPDTIKALQTVNKSPNLLGMIGDIGRGGLSNLESLVRGGVAQVPGTVGDLETLGRMGINTSFGAGGVKVSPKAVMPTTSDILGMMPQRVTQARPETAGMEELGTIVGPGLAKAAMPAVRAGQKGLNLLGMEVADRVATGQSVLPSLLKEPQSAMFAVNPADQMAQAITKAEVSPLGFYSAVEQQALKIPRKQGTGDSFLNDLMKGQDVKKYEIEAMGLENYLRGKPNVTRQEVQDFIANNKLDVQERQLSGRGDKSGVFSEFNPDKNQFMVYGEDLSHTHAFNTAEEADNFVKQFNSQIPYGPSKYDKYQLPGGENYRELLLTLPNKPMDAGMAAQNYYTQFVKRGGEPDWSQLTPVKQQEVINSMPPQARNASASPDYRSSHFDEPNILAHMRVNDRVDAEGKKMLLIEEVQSDWHQAGRERGYASPEANKAKQAFADYSNELADKYNVNPAQNIAMYGTMKGIKPEEIAKYEQLQSAYASIKDAVPDAPFKDTWHQLALKRAIKEAVDKGYDRIGLTTGAQQAERYKLTNEVDEINVIGRTDARTGEKSRQVALDLKSGGSYKLGVNNEGIIDNVNMLEINNLQGKKLADVVGKEVAKKIMESNSQTIKGEGLNIGGEGMKKYYDEVYPNYLNKLGKKYGAQVGETRVKTGRGVQGGEPVRYLDITPEMRKAVKEGQPLASIEEELAKALA